MLKYDDATIYIFALRYASGKSTGAFNKVTNQIIKHIHDFSTDDLQEMKTYIKRFVNLNTDWRDVYEKEILEFIKNIDEETERRELIEKRS